VIDKHNIGGGTGMNKPEKSAQSECNGLLDDAERIKIAKRFCRLIGCSGLSHDLCLRNPLNCRIVQKVGI